MVNKEDKIRTITIRDIPPEELKGLNEYIIHNSEKYHGNKNIVYRQMVTEFLKTHNKDSAQSHKDNTPDTTNIKSESSIEPLKEYNHLNKELKSTKLLFVTFVIVFGVIMVFV